MEAWGGRPVHARQILRSFYDCDGMVAWDELTLPRPLRAKIEAELRTTPAALAARQMAEDGTTKLLLRLDDGRTVESVSMPDWKGERAAGCLSSKVGCAMVCDFCATAQGGFARNLTAGEIVEQFLALRREASGLGVCLAVSLHAPDDATRARLLPMGRRFGVAEILAAADRYQAATGRITTIQYCLLAGVNDSVAHAREIAAVLGGRRMHVNLLRYNPTGPGLSGVVYAPPADDVIEAFLAELRMRSVVAHFRRPRGQGIAAACGQLRGRLERR